LSSTPAQPVLLVQGLTKRFGGVVAVDGVDFEIARGQLLAMIGPNGAGKTTCFNMINGQLGADGGRILFQGCDISRMKPREICRRGVGRTFQITQTYGSMTVRENVQMALLSHHRRLLNCWQRASAFYAEEALELLQRVGMADQANRGCGVLAYGDVKRVELAIALANSPKLLLMDEPTAGMAPKERTALMQLTADIVRERGVAVLFTEHDMDVVFTHADDVIVLNHGEIIARGKPQEVRNDARVREVYLGAGTMFRSR
jgi:branched-chain amino acid transport system ATP-binding protein